MNIHKYIECCCHGTDLDALYSAACSDAWSNPRSTIREIATAINNNNPQALMDAVRPEFIEFMKGVAEHKGTELVEV